MEYGIAALSGIPSYLLQRLRSVTNSAARLVFSSSKYDPISPLLHQLHWLEAPVRIQYKLAVLTFRCLDETAPPYLADEFLLSLDLEAWSRPHVLNELHVTLCLHCLSKFSSVIWKLTFSAVPFSAFSGACEVTYVIIGHFNHFCYILTYLQSIMWFRFEH